MSHVIFVQAAVFQLCRRCLRTSFSCAEHGSWLVIYDSLDYLRMLNAVATDNKPFKLVSVYLYVPLYSTNENFRVKTAILWLCYNTDIVLQL